MRLYRGEPPASTARSGREDRLVEDMDGSDDDNDDDDDDDDGGGHASAVTDPSDDRLFVQFVDVAASTPDSTPEEDRVFELDETVKVLAAAAAPASASPVHSLDMVPATACALESRWQLRRLWSHELAAELHSTHGRHFAELVGPSVLLYEMHPSREQPSTGSTARPLVIAFQFGGLLAAEAFEALLTLAMSTRSVRKGKRHSSPLASVYDPDRPEPFLKAMQARVGPLLGTPPPSGTPVHDAASVESVLSTPMRGLGLGTASPDS